MTGIETALDMVTPLLAKGFIAGFCISCFLVLVVSAFEAVIHVFRKVSS